MAGYAVILLGWELCRSGDVINAAHNKFHLSRKFYLVYYIVCAILAVSFEVAFWCILHNLRRFPRHSLYVSYNFVKEELKAGRQLVLLEDKVLDVGPYTAQHPCATPIFEKLLGTPSLSRG